MLCGQNSNTACSSHATYHRIGWWPTQSDLKRTNAKEVHHFNQRSVVLWHQLNPPPLTSVRVIIRPTSRLRLLLPHVASSTVMSIKHTQMWLREKKGKSRDYDDEVTHSQIHLHSWEWNPLTPSKCMYVCLVFLMLIKNENGISTIWALYIMEVALSLGQSAIFCFLTGVKRYAGAAPSGNWARGGSRSSSFISPLITFLNYKFQCNL